MSKNSVGTATKKSLPAVLIHIKKGVSVFFDCVENILENTKKALGLFAVFSLIINLFLEWSLRQSFGQLFKMIFTSPHVFLLGLLIIFSTLTITFLFKKRTFVFMLASLFWIIIAIVNFYIMVITQRSTPFSSADLRVFASTFEIITNGYLEPLHIVLIVIAAIAVISILVFAFMKCRKNTGFFGKSAYVTISVWSVMLASIVLYINTVIVNEKFDNPPNMFKKHGYAFCFLYGVLDSMDIPANYSSEKHGENRDKVNEQVKQTINSVDTGFTITYENSSLLRTVYKLIESDYNIVPNYPYIGVDKETAESIMGDLKEKYELYLQNKKSDEDKKTFVRPNVIFLQLESFYDVKNIEGYQYSADPTPIFSFLKESLPGGKLTVPSIGAGTANVEFEIITGMDKAYFGFGEYPYFTVLQTQTCESMAYNAKEYGYKTHVIHNHKGTFYDRNKVFPNLGFDTFTSLESMPGIIKNPRNWCKDEVLIEPIIEALKSSENQDLIYTISVQPHGKYPSEELYEEILDGSEPKIALSGNEDNPENPGFAYYVNQINEVDTFIGRLLIELAALDEPTVVVFYGDHLPSFSVQKYWTLKEGDFFQTDYVIWNNCGLDFSDAKDLKTFQLCSYIFSKIGIDEGDFNMLNRLYLDNDNTEDYSNLLHEYAYATFYDKSLKDPSSPVKITTYKASESVLGVTTAKIDNVYTVGNITFILGDNFNEYSKIVADGEKVNTAFMNRHMLMTSEVLDDGVVIEVNQYGTGGVLMGVGKNSVIYDEEMVVLENEKSDILEDIMNSLGSSTESDGNTVDDATEDFEKTNTDEVE